MNENPDLSITENTDLGQKKSKLDMLRHHTLNKQREIARRKPHRPRNMLNKYVKKGDHKAISSEKKQKYEEKRDENLV